MACKKKGKGKKPPMRILPACDNCGKNDKVEYVGTGYLGGEFYCERCKVGWTQEM